MLRSGPEPGAGVATRNSSNRVTVGSKGPTVSFTWSAVILEDSGFGSISAIQNVAEWNHFRGTPAVFVGQGVDHIEPGTRRKLTEVDDNVIIVQRWIWTGRSGSTPLGLPGQRDGVLHDVAVVGDHMVIDAVVGHV